MDGNPCAKALLATTINAGHTTGICLVVFAINHDHPKTPCWLGPVDEDCKERARIRKLEGHDNNGNLSDRERAPLAAVFPTKGNVDLRGSETTIAAHYL